MLKMFVNMFKFFKRSKPSAVKPAPASTQTATPMVAEHSSGMKERRRFARPLPHPEVVEGNGGETDWGLWEDAKRGQVKQVKP